MLIKQSLTTPSASRSRGLNLRWLSAKLLPASLAVLLGLSPAVAAQSPDKILKQAIKAIGGEKAIKSVSTWRAQGVITRRSDGQSGRWLSARMKPNLTIVNYDLGGFETSEAYSGKSGWRRDSRDGVRTVTGDESAAFQAEAFYRNNLWLNAKKEKAMLGFGGQVTVGGKPANVITLTSSRNVKIKMLFDAASGLCIREEIPAGDATNVFEYSDFRKVNGVVEPFAVTFSRATKDTAELFDIKFDSVTHNQPLDRAQFDYPKVETAAPSDLQKLLGEVRRNTAERERLLENYSYTSVVSQREFDKDGSLKKNESKSYFNTRYRGAPIRRLTAENSKPLSASEQAKEDRRIEEQIKDRDKRLAEWDKKQREATEKGKPQNVRRGNNQQFSVAYLLRASRLVNPRRERFKGREVIVFDFEPNPDYKPQDMFDKFTSKLSGAMWIDEAEKQVVRMEYRSLEAYRWAGGLAASLSPGALQVVEYDRVNNEIWLPVYNETQMAVRVFLAVGVKVNRIIRFGDYKRFNVEAEKEKLKDPTINK